MKKLGLLYYTFILLFISTLAWAQDFPSYNIKAQLELEENLIEVKQEIRYIHQYDFQTKTIVLNDWNNAYSSTESPLAKRLVEEYNRSFYLSNKSKRGSTKIKQISIDGETIEWDRSKDQIDIIRLDLAKIIAKGDTAKIKINYTLALPDAKFTGYGITDKENYFLENVFLSIARANAQGWNPISNLDIEDIPNSYGHYNIEFTLPSNLKIQTNLTPFNKIFSEHKTTHSFRNKNKKELLFQIGDKANYSVFEFDGKKVFSNLETDNLSVARRKSSFKKINSFLKNTVGEYPHDQIMLSQQKYAKRPFYGLTLIPGFLKPFPPQFEFEIKALNTYLYHYLTEILPLDPRKDYWLIGGLHTYLMMRYVIKNYPEEKLLGLVLRQPIARFLLKKYNFKELNFEETFLEYHEFVLRQNLQQALTTSKEELIKFNEQIGAPSQMGLLINYVLGFKNVELTDFIIGIKTQNFSGKQLENYFIDFFKLKESHFIKAYLSERKAIDLRFKSITQSEKLISFNVEEKNDLSAPFSVGLVRNDSIIFSRKYSGNQLNTLQTISKKKADYLVINPTLKLPEFNPRNNWKKLGGLNLKPIRLTFFKDLENPKFNQIFYNPRVNFNAYDGISFGVRLNNKTLKARPFVFTLEPLYATKEKALVGSFFTSYSKLNSESDYYLTKLNFAGSSFHYNSNLRYSSIFSSLNFYKRNPNLRDNKKQLFRLFWQYVDRDENTNQTQNPNYSIAGINYIFSNKGALDYFTFNTGIEGGENFGKINLTTEYRHLMRSGRQISLRLFAGKFLWRNKLKTNYFDYALDRPTDYLFQYNYIGRSETSGIYSQQFIPAEGGFKSRFDNPYSDNFLLTLNTSIGLWKWIEAYGDLGYINQKQQASRVLFDTGLRLNLVPDFLELYFPIYNTKGLQAQGPDYQQKIRYVVTFDPRTLTQLFSRKWF